MADARDSVKEVLFEKGKHDRVQKGSLVGGSDGELGVLTHQMPHEILFDVGARQKLPESLLEDLQKQNLKEKDPGRKAA